MLKKPRRRRQWAFVGWQEEGLLLGMGVWRVVEMLAARLMGRHRHVFPMVMVLKLGGHALLRSSVGTWEMKGELA